MKNKRSFLILAAIISVLFSGLSFATANHPSSKTINTTPVVGAEKVSSYLPLLKNKRVGLIVNQTSIVNNEENHPQHLVDLLLANEIDVVRLFAPEHGIRGNYDAGELVDSSKDLKTGIEIVSIYGQSKRPKAQHIEDLDVLVFDIQDVGARFYTYINSMFYMMQAAQFANKPFVVLDRPNPNIGITAGPMLETEFRSFVGLLPIPMIHGLTVGELAKMIVGEGWLNAIEPLTTSSSTSQTLALSVIPVDNYSRDTQYSLPIPPSPNLPNQQSIRLYPSLCLFEGTPVSIGRGTDFPFQVIGFDKFATGQFTFKPTSRPNAAKYPKLENKVLHGEDLRKTDVSGFTLGYLLQWYKLFENENEVFFSRPDFFDKLAGTDKLRKQIEADWTESQIKASWSQDLAEFAKLRTPYLLYL